MDFQTAVSNAPKDGLRGDYSRAAADYSVEQPWDRYTPAQHALWRRLHQRQMGLLPGYACAAYRESLARLDASDAIPRLDEVTRALRAATGWSIVAVPGLIPDLAFFEHLAHRRFPVTCWLREPQEFDYIVEPDIFHDFFGHVPMLFNGWFADYMQSYGEGGLKAARLDALKMLARLYWYTVEFGLILTDEGLRIYGAGILSSGGEVVHSIESPRARRVMFDLERVLRTDYHIDRYQDTYFVIKNFEQLFLDTTPDFTPIYARLRAQPVIGQDQIVPSDVIVPPEPSGGAK